MRGVFRPRLPVGIGRPVLRARGEVLAVAHAEQDRAHRAVDVFMQLARGMHDERARRDVDMPLRRAHHAAAFDAEIDFGRIRMQMVGTDLAGLPAGDRHVAFADPAEYLLDMLRRIPHLLLAQIEYLHASLPAWSVPLFRPARRTAAARRPGPPGSPMPDRVADRAC